MTEDTEPVIEALRAAPEFADLRADACTVTRLGGLTNRVYRVDTGDRSAVVRLPGPGTEAYIDRKVEATNARAAERAGVSPQVILADPDSGVLITETIEGIETMTPALFRSRDGSPARAGRSLAKLHNSGERFDFRFELFAMIEEYLRVLSTRDVTLPEGYHGVVEAAEPVKHALEANPAPLAPCHCDPLCENFLDDGERMWIVDWEYSGMNDPLWDVADLSVEAEMDGRREAELVRGYLGREPTPAEAGRIVVYKAMCDLLWTLWGLIQHADGNPAEDFWAYSTTRFERCKALMNDPSFERHVEAVRAG